MGPIQCFNRFYSVFIWLYCIENNEIAGNKIIDFQTAFADVRELREKTYQNLGP